ncbi:tyrosine-type recombinase/integrase [Frankia sp. AgPm24]|uniref:tyrosine-type recombinase/integrase n=1 Tax=Frankia sp. AgPm24 TaxID=631128 RepID=UPI00200D5B44|nr:tyrosine-type recombinase/integrase [Frankia sp. AgPm24]MCK9921239.1 tyrosine-type recombinase/integrase [Frankia sp. AgPm24]
MVDLEGDVPALWQLLLTGWDQALEAKGRAAKTRRLYADAGASFVNWLTPLPGAPPGHVLPTTSAERRAARRRSAAAGETAEVLYRPDEPEQITRAHIERFLITFATEPTERRPNGRSDAYLNQTYRALQQFFEYLIDEDEIEASPMARMEQPKIGQRLVPTLELDQLAALVATCKSKAFADRRDDALIRVFADTGGRRSEIAGLTLESVDLTRRRLRVIGKGDKERVVAIGNRTSLSINRYLRSRATHKYASEATLWLGDRDRPPMTADGVYQVVVRRGRTAGVAIHPHVFRHTLAHDWLMAGGDLQALADHMGWEDLEMARVYARIWSARRAQAQHERLALGDRI